MPRTPAPLTVEQLRLRGRYAWWNLTDPDGNVVAEFREEADARAFVALPALLKALRRFVERDAPEPTANYCWSCDADVNGRDGPVRDHAVDCMYVEGVAALAQADGPKEQP